MILPKLSLILAAINYTLTDVKASLIDSDETCGLDEADGQTVNILIHSNRNASGRWRTNFVVRTHVHTTDTPLDGDWMDLNLKQSVIKCGDKQFLQVRGVLEQDSFMEVKKEETVCERDMERIPNSTTEGELSEENQTTPEQKIEEPFFFVKGAINTEFSNEKRTVRRKTGNSDQYYGGAITNRPLKDGELFEVKLDEISSKWDNFIMVGLTTISPAEITFPIYITDIKYDILLYYHQLIFYNTSATNYGTDLFHLKVGERVGVMRKDKETVHFYVNGADQGAVKQKFPGTVYGLVDMNDGAVQATILNPK